MHGQFAKADERTTFKNEVARRRREHLKKLHNEMVSDYDSWIKNAQGNQDDQLKELPQGAGGAGVDGRGSTMSLVCIRHIAPLFTIIWLLCKGNGVTYQKRCRTLDDLAQSRDALDGTERTEDPDHAEDAHHTCAAAAAVQ